VILSVLEPLPEKARAMRPGKEKVMGTRQIGRDAKTGRIIPVSVAARRPSTTVVETVKTPPKKPTSPKGK
jgi:hypothetical protein